MVSRNWGSDGKRKLDSRTYRAKFLSLCNKAQKERSSSMSRDSGLDCELRQKKQRREGLACQVTRDVNDGVSALIRQVDETHKKRMVELRQKQNVEILEYFRTKNERKGLLEKMYQLEKDLICEESCGSSSEADKLKQLDENFQINLEGLRREMDKCWKDMKDGHVIARTNEEEMRLKKIELLQLAVSTLEDGEIFEGLANLEGTSLHADSDVTKADPPSTSIDSGNPNTSFLESESAVSTLENGEICTPPTVISRPVSPIQDSSPRKRSNMANDHVQISPADSPKKDLIAIPSEPDEQMYKSTAQVIWGKPISSSSDTEMALENDKNKVCQGLLSSPLLITDSHPLNESGQSTSKKFVIIGSDDKQIYVKPVPVPVNETAFPISSSTKQLDVISIPVTPDNLSTSDCSPPHLKSSLETQGPLNSMQSSEELAVSSDTIHDNSCKENAIICLDSDDDHTMHEISAALPVNDVTDANNLSKEAPGISVEQPNHCSVISSGNELEACFSTEENQHQEAQRMLSGVSSPRGSSLCEALPGGGRVTMNQDTTVGEPSQQIQGNFTAEMHRLFSMAQQQCIDQSRQFHLEQQLPPTQLPSSEIRVTDESLPSSSCQYVTDNHLMLHPTTSVAEGNAQTQLSDITSNYYLNHTRSSYVTRPNSYQRSSFDPLQIELAKINREGYAAKKNYEDMVVQLEISREKEIAQVLQKYGLLVQEAENDASRKRKELESCYEMTKAHMLLAKAWRMEIDENTFTGNTSIFHPSTQVQSTGMPTNALAGLLNQFSGILPTNLIPRPQHPPPYPNLLNSRAGWVSYIQNLSCPTPSIPLQSNLHPLNFNSSGSAFDQHLLNQIARSQHPPYQNLLNSHFYS